MPYRPEIDGLRAIAVLAVILFHAGFDWISGGFIGVDVFFVISGYLITTILMNDLAQKRFSLLGFYERRVRRILPALFFVVLVCIPFSWMWMFASQMQDFSESVFAVSLFFSNIFFWAQSGYFAPAVDTMPLLHTWSLAVEEQFYLVFPVFLLLTWRLGLRNLFVLLSLLALVSLALSEIGWRRDPVANFYLAHARAWELLAGSLAAFVVQRRGVGQSNVLTLIGLLAIIFSIFAFDETTPVPSVYALVPVLGTVLVILFGARETLVARLLGTRVLVGLGLISYSAYLWHQPVFAFARIRLGENLPWTTYVLLIGLSLSLAVFSWKFVETPFRKPQELIRSRVVLFSSSAAVIVCFCVFGAFGRYTAGFSDVSEPRRMLADLERRTEINYGMSDECEWRFNLSENCETSKEPRVLLWGDSYAMHLAQGIIASKPDIKIRQHTISSCSPILGYAGLNVKEGRGFAWVENCHAFNNSVLAWLAEAETVEFVILSSPFDWVEKEQIVGEDGRILEPDPAFLTAQFGETVRRIRDLGVGVVLVSPTPRSGADIGRCLIRKAQFHSAQSCSFAFPNDHYSNDFVQSLEDHISVYWLQGDICDGTDCRAEIDGTMIYRDSGHLSKEGSAYLGQSRNWYDRMKALALSSPTADTDFAPGDELIPKD
ncbi:MAG: acyltransferase family protein [Alphaproteobacteria bacterium]